MWLRVPTRCVCICQISTRTMLIETAGQVQQPYIPVPQHSELEFASTCHIQSIYRMTLTI